MTATPNGPNVQVSPQGATQGSGTPFTPTIIDLAVEVAIVVGLAWVAGMSPEAGSAIIWFFVALWLVFLFSWYKSRKS